MATSVNDRVTKRAVAANSVKNDSGVIVYGGNVGTRWTSKGHTHVGWDSGTTGSRVPQPLTDAQIAQNTFGALDGSPNGSSMRPRTSTYKPYSSGTFAGIVAGQYIVQGYSTKIAGQTVNVLLGASNGVLHRSINRVSNVRTTFLYAWSVNAPSGNQTFYPGNTKQTGTISYSKYQTLMTATNSLGNEKMGQDDASVPTRAIPGEFTYNQTGKAPTNLDYSAITGK